jgi:hypothetical protein
MLWGSGLDLNHIGVGALVGKGLGRAPHALPMSLGRARRLTNGNGRATWLLHAPTPMARLLLARR